MKLAVVDELAFDEHVAQGPHPERPERLAAARSGLESVVPRDGWQRVDSAPAARTALERVHRTEYLDSLDEALDRGWGHLDADTFTSPGTRDATYLAAGGAIALARELMGDGADRGFALLRPPGHHAEPDRAMGFCLLNNVALAAEAALEAGAERVAVVDWDVHHGNGTQHAFEARRDVLFVSLHQYPFYPGTGGPREVGRGEGAGRTVNVALPAGVGDEAYGEAFRRVVLPVIRAHAPDLLLVSAGFDAHARDPLASMELSSECFGAMSGALRSVADDLGHGRLGFILEGGYDLDALEASVASTVRCALDDAPALPEDPIQAGALEAIEATCRAVAAAWPQAFE